jgi:hypothetical protein
MRGAILFGMALVLLSGCSTHEARFERDRGSVSQVRDIANADRTAVSIVASYKNAAEQLPTAALVPLTQAAAFSLAVDRSPSSQANMDTFGEALLRRRVRTAGGLYIYASERGGTGMDQALTVRAGNAWLAALGATKDRRYRRLVVETARTVSSPRFGWETVAGGSAIPRDDGLGGPQPAAPNVLLTASAANFLQRAAQAGIYPRGQELARKAYRAVERAQVATGRWYAEIGTAVPMVVDSWAGTLLSLKTAASGELQGIAEAGADGLWRAAFYPSGRPRLGTLISDAGSGGIAVALGSLQQSPRPDRADKAYMWALQHRRPDGSFPPYAPHDHLAQAEYALAFARRSYHLRFERTQ